MKRFAIPLIVLVMCAPAAARAADHSAEILSILTQIIALQKSLVETLQSQITKLKSEIATLNATAASEPHVCSVINPPACSTSLLVTYDEYNCVTSFFCKP